MDDLTGITTYVCIVSKLLILPLTKFVSVGC